MELTPNDLKFISDFEGCILHPYDDGFGNITICQGFTHYPDGTEVTMGDKALTQSQCDTMFQEEVKPYATGVLDVVSVPLNTNQLCSLTDFAYNCGLGAFKQSTLCQHVKNHCVVEQDFTEYDHAGGQVLQGLLNRRKAEYQLFITPILATNKIMEPTETTVGGATPEVTPQTPKVLKIESITVVYSEFENGISVTEHNSESVSITPELLTALSNPDAGLITAGFGITIE